MYFADIASTQVFCSYVVFSILDIIKPFLSILAIEIGHEGVVFQNRMSSFCWTTQKTFDSFGTKQYDLVLIDVSGILSRWTGSTIVGVEVMDEWDEDNES